MNKQFIDVMDTLLETCLYGSTDYFESDLMVTAYNQMREKHPMSDDAYFSCRYLPLVLVGSDDGHADGRYIKAGVLADPCDWEVIQYKSKFVWPRWMVESHVDEKAVSILGNYDMYNVYFMPSNDKVITPYFEN